jgi:UDP-N-acetylmuramoylalanine--D-glutamate ligase
VASMQEALSEASEISTAGEVVLLSPACASFDWFKNYEQRGKVFKELVAQL